MRVARCCCTTKSSGPVRAAISGPGSGVTSNARLAEYSRSAVPVALPVPALFGREGREAKGLDSIGRIGDHEALGRHERLFLQGVAREVLSREAPRRADARVLRAPLRHGGDQQY